MGFLIDASSGGKDPGLLPGNRWVAFQLPESYLQRLPGASMGSNQNIRRGDWVRAGKSGAPACSNFSIGGMHTGWLVLGTVAIQFEGELF